MGKPTAARGLTLTQGLGGALAVDASSSVGRGLQQGHVLLEWTLFKA